MTKIRIEQLIWDAWNIEHIKKHNISQQEVEEAVRSIKTHKIVKNKRILLIGKSGKRLLSVIVSQEKQKKYYVVTARDAARKERRQYYEKENK